MLCLSKKQEKDKLGIVKFSFKRKERKVNEVAITTTKSKMEKVYSILEDIDNRYADTMRELAK